MHDTVTDYMNPIMPGDYPDPSILRIGGDYYMTHSSFDYLPGLLIWHSRNLTDWRPICHALTTYVGSVWAPDFCKHGERYYIYFPAGGTNWAITAPAPEGPWSDPVDLRIGRIDPGHVAALDGTRYLHLSGGGIAMLANDGLSVVGSIADIYDGWPIPNDWRIEGNCLEGPKLLMKDGWYYLVSAMGGTAGPATSHMAVVARAKHPTGPWENSPYNPLIHTRSRAERWWSRGHGTLIDTPNGDWYCVYHAYEKGFHTLGRQTLLEPIYWTPDGWPIARAGLDIAGQIARPAGESVGNGLALSDDFTSASLGLQWRFQRDARPERYRVGNGQCVLRARGTCVADSLPLTCIPHDHAYEVEVDVEVIGGCEAALLLLYNERYYVGASISADDVCVLASGAQRIGSTPSKTTRATLKLRNDAHDLELFIRERGQSFRKLPRSFEVSGFHHNVLGGFSSLRIALCAYGEGEAIFRNFRYLSCNPIEETYAKHNLDHSK